MSSREVQLSFSAAVAVGEVVEVGIDGGDLFAIVTLAPPTSRRMKKVRQGGEIWHLQERSKSRIEWCNKPEDSGRKCVA